MKIRNYRYGSFSGKWKRKCPKKKKKQVMIENAILALAMKYGRNRTKQKTKEKGAKEK